MKKNKRVAGVDGNEPVIKPTSDIFTAVLWSDPRNEPLLRDFLNAVLIDNQQPPIREAKVLNPFKIKEFAFDKQLILDVLVRDETSRRYNIEVQTAPHSGFCERMLLQWANTYSALLRTGDGYTELLPVKSVVITDFPIFPELSNLHTVFEIQARENPRVLLTDHFQMHFLRLGDMRKRQLEGLNVLFGGLQHWLNFFTFGGTVLEDKMSQLVENNPAVLAAYREFQRFTSDAEMQELERRRRRFLEDHRVYTAAAKAEGIAIGEAKGKAEGKAERDIEIARNMKQAGSDFDFIAQITGLSRAEIERLD